MSSRYTKSQKRMLWDKWILTPISTDLGVYNIAPRHLVIRTFIEKGVIPMLKAKGFLLRGDRTYLTKKYLQYLFALYLGDRVYFKTPSISKEYLDEFEHQVDSSSLLNFWTKWGLIEDFNDGYAYQAQFTLTSFVLFNLDMERSPTFVRLQRLQYEMDDFERERERRDPKGKDDPYLQDTSRYNYEDRHW